MTLTTTWWVTFLSRLLLAAILIISFLYMAVSMPGIKLLEQLAANGEFPTGFELYQSGAMRECGGPYALTVLLPPMAWAWLSPVLGLVCLFFARLKIVLNIIVLPLLAAISLFFFLHAEAIEKISCGLE